MGDYSSIKDWDAWADVLAASPVDAVPDGLPGQWWVAHTRPRNEKALALELRARRVFCYLPLCVRTSRSRNTGRVSRSIVPVFPGYVFINGNDDDRVAALTTNRIAATLAVPNEHQLVGELRQIQHVLAAQSQFEWEPSIHVGQWARVVAGPLMGLEGVVCRRMSRTRLALNVRLLSQAVMVEVTRDIIEPIDPPEYEPGT